MTRRPQTLRPAFARNRIALAVAGLGLGSAAALAFAIGGPVTDDIRANATAPGDQRFGQFFSAFGTTGNNVAMDGDGDFVVAWNQTSNYQYDDVYVRVFDADGTPASGEIRVNQYTIGAQRLTRLAVNAAGQFAVAWSSELQDGDGYGVYARAFNADGTPASAELQVSQVTTGTQFGAGVAIDSDGSFVVTWNASASDGDGYGVYARLFAADGSPESNDVRVNDWTTGGQFGGIVAMDASGNFVATWNGELAGDDDGAGARVFAADGTPVTGDIPLNLTTPGSQDITHLGVAPDGRFAVVWLDDTVTDGGVVARSFAADGTPASGEVNVGMTTLAQLPGALAINADGSYVVAWERLTEPSFTSDVLARVFAADGTPLTGVLAANTDLAGNQYPTTVAVDASGNFGVAWADYDGQDGDLTGAFVRLFEADGDPAGDPLVVPDYTTGFQTAPVIAMAPDGDFVVGWEGYTRGGRASDVAVRVFDGFGGGGGGVDLALTNVDSVANAAQGAAFDYTMGVTNNHATLDATAVTLVADLAGVTYNGFTGANWSCVEASLTVTCTLASALPAGLSDSVILHVQAPAANTVVRNSARVSASEPDPSATNNADVEETLVGTCTPGNLRFVNRFPRVTEGQASRIVAVERRGGSCGAVTVQYAAEPVCGCATNFVEQHGTLSWAAGDTAIKKFRVPLVPDAMDEPNDVILISLSNPTGLATSGADGGILIRDDDPPAVVSISGPADGMEGTDVSFTLSLDAPSGWDIVVRLGLSGSAVRPDDFVFREQRIVIPAGATSVTRDLRNDRTDLVDDAIDDDGEDIVLTITQASNATISPTQASLTIGIIDND